MFLRVYLLDVRNGAREGSNANSFMHSRIAKVGLSGNWHPGRCPRRPPGQEAPFGTPGLDGSPRACRSGPAPRAVRCAVWPLPGGLEAAAEGVRDEVEGAPAAAVVVEEAAAGDAEDGAGEFPTGRVAGVGAVAELAGERFEGGIADAVGALAPACWRAGRAVHHCSLP